MACHKTKVHHLLHVDLSMLFQKLASDKSAAESGLVQNQVQEAMPLFATEPGLDQYKIVFADLLCSISHPKELAAEHQASYLRYTWHVPEMLLGRCYRRAEVSEGLMWK